MEERLAQGAHASKIWAIPWLTLKGAGIDRNWKVGGILSQECQELRFESIYDWDNPLSSHINMMSYHILPRSFNTFQYVKHFFGVFGGYRWMQLVSKCQQLGPLGRVHPFINGPNGVIPSVGSPKMWMVVPRIISKQLLG